MASEGTKMSGTSTSESSGLVPTQLAMLVPTFDPSSDNLEVFQQKVELLTLTWPSNRLTELSTRLILGCKGSAFSKLQLHRDELTDGSPESIRKIITLLGGHWGQVKIEKRYELAERALFRSLQKSDESADSYLARCDVAWTELLSRKVSLEDLQAYVVSRGSQLNPEDKKKVLLDSDASGSGHLTMSAVTAAIRLLGAGFFHELVTGKKSSTRQKIYDQSNAYVTEEMDEPESEMGDINHTWQEGHEEVDDELMECFLSEGDTDAALVADFEAAAADLLQGDEELAAAYNSYADARRRLNEKARHRGFWPVSKPLGGGKGKFHKGKGKGKSFGKKSLQQRIMNSTCRICGARGHWKAECPSRPSSSGVSSTAGTSTMASSGTFTGHVEAQMPEGLPLEFVELPETILPPVDAPRGKTALALAVTAEIRGNQLESRRVRLPSNRFGEMPGSAGWIPGDRSAIRRVLPRKTGASQSEKPNAERVRPVRSQSEPSERAKASILPAVVLSTDDHDLSENSTLGIVDTGATKTVMGSELLRNFITGLHSQVRSQITRCPCKISFKFGNQGVLASSQALVVPLGSLRLKIAVVPGRTPLLLSNMLLRTLHMVIDTHKLRLASPYMSKHLDLRLSERGLLLLDVNELAMTLASSACGQTATETFVVQEKRAASQSDGVSSEACAELVGEHAIPRAVLCPEQTSSNPLPNHVGACSSHQDGDCEGRGVDNRVHEPGDVGGVQGELRTGPPGGDLQPGVESGSSLVPEDGDHVRSLQPPDSSQTGSLRRAEGDCTRDRSHRGQEDGEWHHDDGGQEQGQGQGSTAETATPTVAARGQGRDRGERDLLGDDGTGHGNGLRSGVLEQRGSCAARQAVRHGECAGADCATPAEGGLDHSVPEHAAMTVTEALMAAGDLDADGQAEHVVISESHDKALMNRLVRQYHQELKACQATAKSEQAFMFEVFSSPNSQLTSQCQKLGLRARRFGLFRANLMSAEGRKDLFRAIHEDQPCHIWYASVCKYWSGFSQLNGQKSITAWNELVRNRIDMMQQLALGVVLLEHQRRVGRDFHWEQPNRSLAFRLSCMRTLRQNCLETSFDMCEVGDLRDPLTSLALRKGTTVYTTSNQLHVHLDQLKCRGQHMHQKIEGQTMVDGKKVSRAQFTENYSRKFARQVIRILRQASHRSFMRQSQFALAARGRELSQESPAKRMRLAEAARVRRRVAEQPTQIQDVPEGAKRRRLIGKQSGVAIGQAHEVLREVDQDLPRVGKMTLSREDILEKLRQMFPDKHVVTAVGCRGTDRTLVPKPPVAAADAPFRRSVMILRSSGRVVCESQWEQWDGLPKTKVIRKNHPCKICVTVFGREHGNRQDPERPHEPENSQEDQGVNNPRDENPVTREGRPEQESNEPDEKQTDAEVGLPKITERERVEITANMKEPEFQRLDVAERQWLVKIHQNLGHPSPERLAIALRNQGCSENIIAAARKFACSTCLESQRPRLARPATLRDELDFNDRISMDSITFVTKNQKTFHLVHIVDHATGFQSAFCVPGPSSEAIIDGLMRTWLIWAGAPGELTVDAATALCSEEIMNFLQSACIKCHAIAPRAHWQNGKAERHGSVLQEMLHKYDAEHPIENLAQMQHALWLSCQAKNALSLHRGYSPEVLVLGKRIRLPGSVLSDETSGAHLLSQDDTAQGIQFREHLARRETARKAFHAADNSAAIRRAMLRRTRPIRDQYAVGEWVMLYKQEGSLPNQGRWIGPLKVINPGDQYNIWATRGGKLFRGAPEHFRPVSAWEAGQIREVPDQSSETSAPQANPGRMPLEENTETGHPARESPGMENPQPTSPQNPSRESDRPGISIEVQSQSDPEPEHEQQVETPSLPQVDASQIPVPVSESESEALWTMPDDMINECVYHEDGFAWRIEIDLTEKDIEAWRQEEQPHEMVFLATAAKRQRSEVKMQELTPQEREQFEQAKVKEVQNWLSNKAVERIVRSKLSPQQVLRCRWILTWKPIDPSEVVDPAITRKAKARIVVLGYLDPNLTDIPRDSPTMSRHSRMLLLQLFASSQWSVGSFDIKAAFLQGRPQEDRIIGLEPVPELARAMKLDQAETLRLVKSAYGLIDAPYLWYSALKDALLKLSFEIAPWDPCVFILRNPETHRPDGAIGIHVDDGLCAGNPRFHEKLKALEKQYAFGSRKTGKFTFTGIDISQRADFGIVLSQASYVNSIQPIKLSSERKAEFEQEITQDERHQLRGLVGSLQYAAVHTRPDIASRLSMLQSVIPKAKVEHLMDGNRLLHDAKRCSEVSITIQPIPIMDVRFLAFSDASFASAKCPDSHAGSIILSAHRDIGRNVPSAISPLAWSSRKIQKAVVSTLAAETVALNSTLDQLSWLRLYWAWLLDHRTPWRTPSEALRALPEAFQTVMVKDADPSDLITTDCKSLFDLLTRTAPPQCTEFRTMLHARAVKDLLSEGVGVRWVPSGAQLADSLTKCMTTRFLRETLRLGQYRLTDEDAVLKARSSHRDRVQWLHRTS